jgi:hypothetical protein
MTRTEQAAQLTQYQGDFHDLSRWLDDGGFPADHHNPPWLARPRPEESRPMHDPFPGPAGPTEDAPVKLMVRPDHAAGVLRAWFALTRDESRRVLVAALSLSLAEQCPAAFQSWKALLTDALVATLRRDGVEVVGCRERVPEDRDVN